MARPASRLPGGKAACDSQDLSRLMLNRTGDLLADLSPCRNRSLPPTPIVASVEIAAGIDETVAMEIAHLSGHHGFRVVVG